MTADDLDLLRQFTRDQSQDAFTALLHRHLNLVYSAALRQVRSPQLAEEVAQSVFIDLARQAAQLKPETVLTAWLYEVTRRTAVDVVRRESRRQARERFAAEMTAMNTASTEWTHIEPLLDEAMESLEPTDRAAVLLRYFENRSLRDVGRTLGVSDDAAQKRVSRAVEQLREFFSKRNVTAGAGGLAVLISANAVQSAPTALAATISAGALASTAVSSSTIIAATRTVAMTTLQKSIIGTALAVVAGTGMFEAHQASQLQSRIQTLQQQQSPLAGRIRQLRRERDDAATRLTALAAENERLRSGRDETNLLKLRAEVTRLQNELRQKAMEQTKGASDPDELAGQTLVDRVKLLKERFKQPGQTIPEMKLLKEQDWLNLVIHHKLDSDDTIRDAMAELRTTARFKFGDKVNQALGDFAKSNHGQLPSDLSELKPYLPPPLDSFLDNYEIARPGWVHPPQPGSPNSQRAKTWALVMKGSFTADGVAIRDGSYLLDPDYDRSVVIYKGGSYAYGPDRPLK